MSVKVRTIASSLHDKSKVRRKQLFVDLGPRRVLDSRNRIG